MLFLQFGGMVVANFVCLYDRLNSNRWLFPIGLRPRVRWSLPFFFVVWIFSLFLQFVTYAVLKKVPAFEGDDLDSFRAISTISICNAIMICLIPILTGPGLRPGLERLGLTGPYLRYQFATGLKMAWLVSPYVYLVNFVANLVFEPQSHEVMKMLDGGLSTGTVALSAVTAVVFAPLAEEIMFRSLLLGALIRKTSVVPADRRAILVKAANVACSLLFALLHSSAWPAPFGIFLLSLALGKLYISTGRLWPCIVAHAVFNLTGVLGMVMFVMSRNSHFIVWIS
jgi:membrane protease YdiL (CAAX protease family)